jgi:hypothetical protein
MIGSRIEIAPERIAEGKHLYETTLMPLGDIAALMGVSRTTLTRRVAEWGWLRRSPARQLTERAVVATAPAATAIAPASRLDLAARILTVAERSLAAVDRVLAKVGPADEAGAERSARTLAAVARSLREMTVLTRPQELMPPDDADDDPIPRDIDEFRRELARRIHALVDARTGERSGNPDGAAAGA